jgi:hypothetical protein
MKAAEAQATTEAEEDEQDPLRSPWVTERGGR